MSAARKLLDDLAVIGATVEPAGDRLILRAGPTAIPADLISRVRQTKAEILATLAALPAGRGWNAQEWRAFYDERAGILEFDGGMPRPAAEAQAVEACIVEWLNRNSAPSPPGRCAWCGQPDADSAAVLPFGTEPGIHAWLHSACWRPWQEARRAQAMKILSRFGIPLVPAPSEGPQL